MTVDTRFTDDRVSHYINFVSTTRTNPWNSKAPTGKYKSITSERSGAFVPGQFRFNPATIVTSSGTPGGQYDLSLPSGYRLQGNLHWYFWSLSWNGNASTLPLTGSNLYGFSLPGVVSANSIARSKLGAHDKLQAPTTEAGVFMAELSETLAMLKDPLKKLRAKTALWYMNGYTEMCAKRIPWRKALADTWLEVRYGILPLISDISSFIELANSKLLVDRLYRFRGRSDDCGTLTANPSKWPTYGQIGYNIRETFTYKNSYMTHLGARLNREGGTKIWERLGLSPFDALRIGYELIPFSFLLDWWIDVGSWLTALRGALTFDLVGGGYTIKQEIVHEMQLMHVVDGYLGSKPIVRLPEGQIPAQYVYEKLTRVVDPTVPYLPALNLNLSSWKHLVDSLALMIQMTKFKGV